MRCAAPRSNSKRGKPMPKNPAFIEELRHRELLSDEVINRILKTHKQDTYAVFRHLIAEGVLTKNDAAALWADSLNVSWVDLSSSFFQTELLEKLPRDFAKKNEVILVYRLGEMVTAAMSDPTNVDLVVEIQKITGERISPVFSLREEIDAAIEVQYHSADELKKVLESINMDEFSLMGEELSAGDLKRAAGNAGIHDFADRLLMLAVKEHASDIHIEPSEAFGRVRFRKDGMLSEKLRLSREVYTPFISHLKVRANMDIAERRKPQDGRIALQLGESNIDFRISTIPTIYGEKMVLRVLGSAASSRVASLDAIDLSTTMYAGIMRLIKSPNGIFFITGPTGSGKSTTLFAALKEINRPEVNIMTVEDPVEYRLPGLNQIQVNREAGLTFTSILRSALRQDPNVLLVGEIRDAETAQIAAEAALTGHLVLATLHTNNAVQAATRLIEVGVEPFAVSAAFLGAMAQRLARRLCDSCKEAYDAPREMLARHFTNFEPHLPVKLYRAKGCRDCGQTGYSGRVGVFELMVVDSHLRELVAQNHSLAEITAAAESAGYLPMRYDAMKKMLRGLTTLEEVERLTAAAE